MALQTEAAVIHGHKLQPKLKLGFSPPLECLQGTGYCTPVAERSAGERANHQLLRGPKQLDLLPVFPQVTENWVRLSAQVCH